MGENRLHKMMISMFLNFSLKSFKQMVKVRLSGKRLRKIILINSNFTKKKQWI